jgi:hypothetical protein
VTLALNNPLAASTVPGLPEGLPQRLLVRHGLDIQSVPMLARRGATVATVRFAVHGLTAGATYRFASSYQLHPESGFVGEAPWSEEVEFRVPAQPRPVVVRCVTATEVRMEVHNSSWRDALRSVALEVQYGGDVASLEAADPVRLSLIDSPAHAVEYVPVRCASQCDRVPSRLERS